jgi:polyferredoxin
VQSLFLVGWLGPFGLRMHQIPGCVFHCYACPLASFACPIGVIAQYSALHLFPLLAVGILIVVGALLGSLVCGWACPFGFLQDLVAKIPTPKVRIPSFLRYGRYLTLIALVIVVPYLWGEHNWAFICNLCPAGALESNNRFVGMIRSGFSGASFVRMGWLKGGILAGFVLAMLFTHRPWCTVFCPLGGIFGLFNRFSAFFLRFDRKGCIECNLCRSNCKYGVASDKRINTTGCTRCLECTTCGGFLPAAATIGAEREDATAETPVE